VHDDFLFQQELYNRPAISLKNRCFYFNDVICFSYIEVKIMKKFLCLTAVLTVCTLSVFAQTAKPRLGILPFTGAGGDGETGQQHLL